ncbi:putative methyltransferase NSUN7 [Lampris incognitus]|uniref:putative methyltransferase NSUN7 n=1 Tax=Lampris incognitus TaxID=2546036 RepID=UPI0024B5382C|nr:putative methyltransferase NSUN7 [Lampris incognitus]
MHTAFPMEKSAVSNQGQSPQRDLEAPTKAASLSLSLLSSATEKPLSSLHSPSPPSTESRPSDQAYLQAAALFQQLRMEKPVPQRLLHYGKRMDTAAPSESQDRITREVAHQLAFNTLKYQDLLENVVMDSCIHTSQQISADLLPLVMVMLFDLQDKKFMVHERPAKEEELLQEVRDLESCLQRFKTKLAASLARCRVKQSLLSVSNALPDSVRTKQQRAKQLPLYAWVNTLKKSVDEVCELLRGAGMREVDDVTDLKESAFCTDPLCTDTLVFPQQLHTTLQYCTLSTARVLNMQDRSVCLAVEALRSLLAVGSDILVAGSFSALTVAHIAVLAAACSGRVLVCGTDHTARQKEEMKGLLRQMNIKNVRTLSERFLCLDEWDGPGQRVKTVLVLPKCSSSALNDPVHTILSEHGDCDLLQDLSQGSVSQSKIHKLATKQACLLAHALTFPRVQTVVYCTRSVYPEENEQLVKTVLEEAVSHRNLLPFRVSGPVFSETCESGPAGDKFLRIEPSQHTNGCFITLLAREADPTKVETVQDVLARARAKGLLNGVMTDQSKTDKKARHGTKLLPAIADKSPSPSQGTGWARPSSTKTRPVTEQDLGSSSVSRKVETEGSGEGEREKLDEDNKGGKKEKRGGPRKKKGKTKQHPRSSKQTSRVSKHRPNQSRKKVTKRKGKCKSYSGHTLAAVGKMPKGQLPALSSTLTPSLTPLHHSFQMTPITDSLAADLPTLASQQPTSGMATPRHPLPTCLTPSSVHVGPNSAHLRKSKQGGLQAVEKNLRGNRDEATRRRLRPADLVLPPISSPSSSSISSGSCVPSSLPPSQSSSSSTSRSRLTQTPFNSSKLKLSSLD